MSLFFMERAFFIYFRGVKLIKLVNYQATDIKESDIPSFPYRDKWFNREILLELSYIKHHSCPKTDLK